ncbi:cell wall hydrolase [Indioceanicola profundi]|uniref:cell wall hydrolase n=1 Tax=Indioceanicola profundi TaxID=2220096 RepID=UPI0013C3EB2D|nr:cell wall hydrolase [Indioceanicola profundi]
MTRRILAFLALVLFVAGCAAKPPPPPPAAPPPPPGPSPEEIAFREAEIECLAQVVYFEARGESEIGRRAVAAVVMNRVGHDKFPDTICGVVRQGGETPPCQFSWWCDGQAEKIEEQDAWMDAKRIAREMFEHKHPDPTNGAMYFHRRDTSPDWMNVFRQTAQIDDHIYYRPVTDDQI